MNPQMLGAIAPFCDQYITNTQNQSVVRNRLAAFYSGNQQLRNEYVQYAAMYAQAMMNQGQAWQNAAQIGAEAVASIFMMRLAQNDQQVSMAFSQDQNAAAITAGQAQQAQNVIQSVSMQNQYQNHPTAGMGHMNHNAINMQAAFAPSMSAPQVQLNHQQHQRPNMVTLPVAGNAMPHQNTMAQNQPVQKAEVKQTGLPTDAQPGVPPLFDKTKTVIEYIQHRTQDYFKETKQMDANAHNHSPAFFNDEASYCVAALVTNDPVTGTDGAAKRSSIYSIESSNEPQCTRVLKNDEDIVYVIADLPELSADQTHICHMPTIDMVIAADLAKSTTGLDASAVRDAELIEKIIYGKAQWTYETINECIKASKNIKDFAKSLENVLARCINAAYGNENETRNVVRINSVIRAFISILNSYIKAACKKPNISKSIIDEIGDVPDLVEWLEKADNAVYRSISEPVSFAHWINHNFVLSMYEGSDNLTIESRKAVVYSTMLFQQLGVSFADNCDKAILTEDMNPWVYYYFATHLQSSAGKRLYCPVRYFFSDDVNIDVIHVNMVTGQMLVTLVK